MYTNNGFYIGAIVKLDIEFGVVVLESIISQSTLPAWDEPGIIRWDTKKKKTLKTGEGYLKLSYKTAAVY